MKAMHWAVAAAALFVAHGAVAEIGWLLSEKSDPLTDQMVSSAILNVGETAIIVRCSGSKFDVYVEFGEYLNSDLVTIRYRIDKGELREERWFPSAKGTAVFASEDTGLARAMVSGKTLIVEATDFRGQPHRVTFDLANASVVLPKVLGNCGLSEKGMDELVEGLRENVALELERWGPKSISVNKRILVERGFYSGPLGEDLNPEFAIAVQTAYDDYIDRCNKGKAKGIICETMETMRKNGGKPYWPPVSAVLYEIAPKNLKKEAGKLRMGN